MHCAPCGGQRTTFFPCTVGSGVQTPVTSVGELSRCTRYKSSLYPRWQLEKAGTQSAGSHAHRAGGLRCLRLSAVNSNPGATPHLSTLLAPSGWKGRGRYRISWLDCFIKVYRATDGHCPMFSRPESETKAQEGLMSLKTHNKNCSLFLSRVQWPSIFSSFWLLSLSLASHSVLLVCQVSLFS